MNKNRLYKSILFLAAITLYISCSEWLISPDTENTPINNFEILWNDYNEHYALFEERNINWDSLYTVYRPQVTDEMTGRELYNVITSLLANLNDGHVQLRSAFGTFFSNTPTEKYDSNFSINIVKQHYLNNNFKIRGEGRFTYGKIFNDISYLHISSFGYGGLSVDSWTKDIDKLLNDGTNNLIVDVRDNQGGSGLNAYSLAGRFAKERILALYTQTKNGPSRSDFTQLTGWYLEPEGFSLTSKSVILLTNRFSGSAAEHFTLALKLFPNITVVGDTTSGSFANNIYRELLNGWVYRISIQKVFSAEKICYEGIGIPPDIYVKALPLDAELEQDIVLDYAIELFE
ncbi:MAG: S41 family peptidase [Melioribacteraceae bacterium]|nr:S41 family peptidase [Melioribacteraceae bacterium]